MTTEGVDYAFSNPSPLGLAAAGKHFAMRYVGPGSASKHLTVAERDRLWAAGLSIVLLVEGATGDVLAGYAVGRAHAQSAESARVALGAPALPLYFAADRDMTVGNLPAINDYLRGAASVIGANRVGIYGEYDVMGWTHLAGTAAWFFQTYAWSGQRWFPLNHVEQYHNTQPLAGGTVDLCRALVANFGQWTRSGAAAPIAGDDDMASVADTITYEIRPWTAGALQGVSRLEAAAAEDKTRDAGMLVALQALAGQITAGGGSVDVAAITAAVQAEAATTRTLVEQLQQQLAAANAELIQLRQALGAGAQAQADALAPTAP